MPTTPASSHLAESSAKQTVPVWTSQMQSREELAVGCHARRPCPHRPHPRQATGEAQSREGRSSEAPLTARRMSCERTN
ncbi:hypothetical protein H920_06371 [Fukomys damarensis]|uniref:Uncharacterized protein n=1 Tax=Fukomys damarensis TaxID=885580 RepID=A0A091DP98_FUKDA|nr:hypothetical protein H920_06371 [Fukomys damarensis]